MSAPVQVRLSTLAKFLTQLTLDPPDATSDEAGAPLLDEDYLIVPTIQCTKGQEWRSVFVLNVVEGVSPPISPPAQQPKSRRSVGFFTSQ